MSRRVVITGMGALSCAGLNLAEARANFIAGNCCLSPITDPRAAALRAKFAGLLRGDRWRAQVPPAFDGFDRHVAMAFVAAREALGNAGVESSQWGRRLGLIFSTCSGPMLLIEAHYERIVAGHPAITAEQLFAKRYYAGAAVLAQTLGISGLSTTVVTACSASTAAIALAADLIRCGQLEAALMGGADAFALSTLAGFDGLKATSAGKCAPFSKPPGLNLGEAAAFLFLESAESADQRGARIRAELWGVGMSNDAYHCSAPDPGGRGLAAAMRRALRDARLSPEHISYINAHGTGTEANDKAECKAVQKVLGERAAQTPISSTKSLVGHCLGAAGAIETVASIVCAEAGVLPPTANFTEAREGCAVDCVAQAGREWSEPRVFLSNNAAFGGHNASLALAVGRCASVQPAGAEQASFKDAIVITGCGVVSAAGIGVDALVSGESQPARFRSVPLPGLPPVLAGVVDEEAVIAFDRRLNLREMDRSSRFATVAARMAMREANFPQSPAALAELGLFLNLSAGPSWAESEYLTGYFANRQEVTQLAAFPYIVTCSVAGNVCRELRLSGHNVTLNGGPGAGLFGLPFAIAALRSGHAGALLCGAVDELSERILADRAMAGEFAADAKLVPGEGAAVLMLETEQHARQRGAQPLARILGMAGGTAVDAARNGDSDSAVVAEVVQQALQQAGISPVEVAMVCSCGHPSALEDLERAIPAGLGRRVCVANRTGALEASQPLADLATALRQNAGATSPQAFSLLFAASPHGSVCATVLASS